VFSRKVARRCVTCAALYLAAPCFSGLVPCLTGGSLLLVVVQQCCHYSTCGSDPTRLISDHSFPNGRSTLLAPRLPVALSSVREYFVLLRRIPYPPSQHTLSSNARRRALSSTAITRKPPFTAHATSLIFAPPFVDLGKLACWTSHRRSRTVRPFRWLRVQNEQT